MKIEEILKEIDELMSPNRGKLLKRSDLLLLKGSDLFWALDVISSLIERVKEAEKLLDKADHLIYPEYSGTSILEEFDKECEVYREKYK